MIMNAVGDVLPLRRGVRGSVHGSHLKAAAVKTRQSRVVAALSSLRFCWADAGHKITLFIGGFLIMNSRTIVASALAVLGAPVFFAAPAAAVAAGSPPPRPPVAADVKFVYAAPRISADGEHVTWRWTLTNAGSGAAADVVLVNHLTPQLKISNMSKECRAIANAVSCSYGKINAGERRTGALGAELSRDVSGTVEITGRVTWQQGMETQLG
jgi:hypothetical protein